MVIPGFSRADSTAVAPSNVGFIPGNIWYSKDPFFEGDTVTVYTVVSNGGTGLFSGTVEFFDQNVILGKKDFSIAPGLYQTLSISWQVTAGDHAISAQIINANQVVTGVGKQSMVPPRSDTGADKRFVAKKVNAIVAAPGAVISDAVSAGLTKTQDFVNSVIPAGVKDSTSSTVGGIDSTRASISDSVSNSISDTQKTIDSWKPTTNVVKGKTIVTPAVVPGAVEKPFTYVKLFFLKLLSLIFSHKWIFYILLVYIIFIILRFIYRKIRGRNRKIK